MGEIVVYSRAVTRFTFSRLDKFEARNRPHLHILVRDAVQWSGLRPMMYASETHRYNQTEHGNNW